jgi:hypothetical protein
MNVTEQIAIVEGSLEAAVKMRTRAVVMWDKDELLSAYGQAEYVYGAAVVLMGFATGEDQERAMHLANQASAFKNDVLRELRIGRR